ncbi:MAG: CoxG family protein, partial [Gemmatimonadales bacterium]
MELVFEGTTAIAADRPRVFARLMDPNAVAACVPAVQSVEAVDPSHFKVLSALGIGSIRVRFTLDIQITETSPPAHASMTVRGKAPGSAVDMTSSVELTEAGAATRLAWR